MEPDAQYRPLCQGEMLNWYRIERVLGRGGFGVIYLATDTNLDYEVAIKEYRVMLPHSAYLTGDAAPVVRDSSHIGVQRFIAEARNLVRFNHPNIVRVMSVFELNDTAYMVMEFEEGNDLREHLAVPANASEQALKQLFLPISNGLEEVHRHGFVHRDIKPANILVRRVDGSPVLLDFGSARNVDEASSSTMTALVSAGYSPFEQYSTGKSNQQGPWTDIYALGGVLYFAVCGQAPIDSAKRCSAIVNGGMDPFLPAKMLGQGRYSDHFLSAIDWALAFRIDDRPKSLSEWMPALLQSSRSNRPSSEGLLKRQTEPLPFSSDQGLPHYPLNEHADSKQPVGGKRRSFFSRKGVQLTALLLIVGSLALSQLDVLKTLPMSEDQASSDVLPQGELPQVKDKPSHAESLVDSGDSDLAQGQEEAQLQEKQREATALQREREASELKAENERKEALADQKRRERARAEQIALKEREQRRRERERARARLSGIIERVTESLNAGRLDLAERLLDEGNTISPNHATLNALTARWKRAAIEAKKPISDADFDAIVENFERLKRALQSKDVAAMNRLTIKSDQNDLFEQLMSSFATLEISINQIQVRSADKSILSTLRIETMIRSNGDRATPSPAYQDRVLASRRKEGKWSLIEW